MNWTPEAIGLIAVAVSIAIAVIASFYRSPNQQIDDLNKRLTEQASRMNGIEVAHNSFMLQYTKAFTEHDGAIEHLTEAIKTLTAEVKNLQGIVKNEARSTRAASKR